ncbi:MAG: condensation domain-containing protein, partial [Cyanobacteria bacterium P01_G01_bin.38]
MPTRKTQLSAAKQALLAQRLQGKGRSQRPTIPRRDPAAPVPLSFSQQRLWFLHQFEPDNPFYNVPFAIKIEGKLDITALEQAFQALVQRHEVLRTTIADGTGHPEQVVHPQGTVTLHRIDLSAQPTPPWDEVKRLARHEAGQSFDLRQGPLLRGTILTLTPAKYVLLITLHHIISDVWSTGILVREVVTLYHAFTQAQPAPLPALPIQYADFTLWQRQWLKGERLQTQIQYWQQQFATPPPVLQLPADRPRPAVQSFRGESQTFSLSPSLTTALKTLSQAADTTLFMTLLAAFKVLLYRYTGQTDITVGSPIANRNQAAIEGLMGLFMNTLALRTQLTDTLSFRAVLSRVRRVALGAYGHQDLPFEKLIEVLQLPRDLSHTPLFQVMFILQNAPLSFNLSNSLPGLTLSPVELSSKTAKFDLTMTMTERAGGLTGGLEYNTDLFDAATIDRLIGHFQTLLAGIVAHPEMPICKLPWLTPPEWTQLHTWNQTTVQDPSPVCLHQLFEAQVAKTPGAIAVTCGQHQLTYAELNHRADRLAHHLQSIGVGPDSLVGLCLVRSLDMMTALLGVLKAAGAYVPLDPDYPQQRLAFMIEDANLAILLTQSALLHMLPDYPGRVLCLDRPLPELESGTPRHQPPPGPAQPENLAYMIYTSGSTGKPKGVQISHRAVVNFLQAQRQLLGIASQDVLLAVTSLCFDIAALELFLPLTVGAQVVIVSREVTLDGFRLAEQLQAVEATFMQATPSTWRMLLLANWTGQAGLKLLCGGEALPSELAAAL